MRPEIWTHFQWPFPSVSEWVSVGEILANEMASNGWEGAEAWSENAKSVAPTLVGGSKKHGGADLGPTRAKEQWRSRLGVDGRGIADNPPPQGFEGLPRLTNQMAAILQGFPADWVFCGRKTSIYRQIGNAFPPPVAAAVGKAIRFALEKHRSLDPKEILQKAA
jgi:DNA (cytosine-5)-methyltransferase 1